MSHWRPRRFSGGEDGGDTGIQQFANCIDRTIAGDHIDRGAGASAFFQILMEDFNPQGVPRRSGEVAAIGDQAEIAVAEFVEMFEREFDSLLFIGVDLVDSIEVIAGRVDADHGERPVTDPEFFPPVLIGDGDCSGDHAIVEGAEIGGGDQDGAIVSVPELFTQGLQKQGIVAGIKAFSGDQGDVPDSGAMIAELSSDIQHMRAHVRGDLRGTAEHPRYGCR